MYQIKQSICYPGFGVRANEDAVGYGRNYCFVMDGASCLSGKNIIHPVSDAAWMVTKVRDGLCSLLDSGDDRPTGQLLRQIVAQVREEYTAALRAKGVNAPDDSPSAGFAMFRQRNGKLEFFGLGDCVGVANIPGSKPFYSLNTILPNLDHKVLEEMVHIHKTTGVSMQEARRQCNDMLIRHRNLRNRPGGYWILDLLTDEGIANADQREWTLTEPVCVGAFSDGFAQLAEVFGQYKGYTALFAAMQTEDLEDMFQKLCALQDADPECNNYPRFKHRDDTCALWDIFTPN